MFNYKLTYRQPYEYDEDSPSGEGDHSIGYAEGEAEFVAQSDREAERVVRKFLSEDFLVFSHHLDGDGKTYMREFVRLVRVAEVALCSTRREKP